MSKQIGLTGSKLCSGYMGTKKYSMLLPASHTPLKDDTAPLLLRTAVCCPKEIKILCILYSVYSKSCRQQLVPESGRSYGILLP